MRNLIYRLFFILTMVMVFSSCASWMKSSQPEGTPFVKVDGWGSPGNIEQYTRENVFNYINGASEFYLSYGFQELWVAEYTGSDGSSLMVEVYRHATPVNAFGIYTQERSTFATFIDMGIQGYCEPPMLIFLKGAWYVKINGYGEQAMVPDNLVRMANAIAGRLPGSAAWPAILSAFPADGKVQNSETYIAKDFLGYSFFPDAYQCDYTAGESDFRVFIIDCDDVDDCREMLEQYQPLVVSTSKIDEKRYLIFDPYHGLIALQWAGSFIYGILDTDDEELAISYLELTAASIQAYSDR